MAAQILQLTDLHLISDPDKKLRGVPTRDSLIDVLEYVNAGVQSGRWDFDYLIITGDLTHDEEFATYEGLRELLGESISQCRIIPGNHDARALIRQVFPELVPPDGSFLTFSLDVDNWRLIGLDTHVPGEVAGDMDSEQLAWLCDELTSHADQPTILFMHHPPFPVRSLWLDRIGLNKPARLTELIQSFPQVQAVSTGHVHHEFKDTLGEIQLLTTPSTGVQFRPHVDNPVGDAIPPGFRTFTVDGDTFQSEVVRLPELRFPPEEPS